MSITKYGSLITTDERTPPPAMRILRVGSGECQVNLPLGTDHQIKPGSLVLLRAQVDGPTVAVAEVLLARAEDSDARLIGYWNHCPGVFEVKPGDCPSAADGVVASRPRLDHLGPEEAEAWAKGLRSISARPDCAGWEPPPERERVSGIDDYQ